MWDATVFYMTLVSTLVRHCRSYLLQTSQARQLIIARYAPMTVRQGEQNTTRMIVLQSNNYGLSVQFDHKLNDIPAEGDIIHDSGKGRSASGSASLYCNGCQFTGRDWYHCSTLFIR